ncbi:hypothetical protein PV379_04720 [Streptomyces caniscabiei]|uniref:tetratricopeptide repeat protein n=1 Tax=Streptomyces caniscabiei TaxID=2746961 RepID=UPI0029B83C54|nr:hypothetical protein [Streptomyces caniscabiei]MDX2776634.1 hypothetical protein [Streptomyces caniscabiei]
MKEGQCWLRLGGYVRARGNFTRALETTSESGERAAAQYMRGIVHYLMGNFSTAHQDFKDALRHAAPGSILAGRIMREQGLCYLHQARGEFGLEKKAYDALLESYNILKEVHTYEASMTLSCIGEYRLFVGDRKEGMRSLRQAVRELDGKDARYEINCRLRLAKTSTLWRWVGMPRAFIAGVQTADGFVELIEYALLLVGGKRLAGAGKRGLNYVQLIMTRR